MQRRILFILFLLFESRSACMAQLMLRTPPQPCQWLGQNMVIPPGQFDRDSVVMVRERITRGGLIHERQAFPILEPLPITTNKYYSFRVNGDTIYRIDKHSRPGGAFFYEIRAMEGMNWNLVASHQRPPGRPSVHLFPLRNGKVLAVDTHPSSKHIACIVRPNAKGELDMDDGQEVDLGHEPRKLRSLLFHSTLSSDLLMVGATDQVLVIHVGSGWWWAFSSETGQLKRSGRLFDEIVDQHLKNQSIGLVLAAHPLADGDVLLLSRDPKVVYESGSEFSKEIAADLQISPHHSSPEAGYAFAKRRSSERELRHPILHWLRYSPTSGRFKLLESPPVGGMGIIGAVSDLNAAVRWLPSADGEEVFPSARILASLGPNPAAPPKIKRKGST